MSKFEPIKRKPGELIRSEDWNKIQEDIKSDLERLEEEIRSVKRYVESMTESVVLTNLESPVGASYRLDENVPGETDNYASKVVGHITKQWVIERGKIGEICRFGILASFDVLYYWSGADNGDKKTLEIMIEYVDGTRHVIGDIFIHEWSKLRPKGAENPYVEYLLSPNERVWYKYKLINPNPEKEVRYIYFRNINSECTPRIGNVIQYVAKIKPLET